MGGGFGLGYWVGWVGFGYSGDVWNMGISIFFPCCFQSGIKAESSNLSHYIPRPTLLAPSEFIHPHRSILSWCIISPLPPPLSTYSPLPVPRLPTPSCMYSQSTTSTRARIYIPTQGGVAQKRTRNGNKKGIRVSSEGDLEYIAVAWRKLLCGMEWKTQGGDDDERDSSAARKGEGEYRNTEKLNEKRGGGGGKAPVTELVTSFLSHTHIHVGAYILTEAKSPQRKKVLVKWRRRLGRGEWG
jgi:hypothetical protein